jgi:methenyltetrahydrofolate cyclohydrolase
MNYKDESIKKYLDDLAADTPAPGGGSAAALTAGMGAALISMVANFTIGKPKYAAFEEEIKAVLSSSEKLREEFLRLVDLDITAYESKNMRDALNIPFMVCRLCYEGIKLCSPLITRGNVNLISDVAVAAILLESAFAAAYFNVEINLKTLDDKKLSKAMTKELMQKGRAITKIRLMTEEKVDKIIRR